MLDLLYRIPNKVEASSWLTRFKKLVDKRKNFLVYNKIFVESYFYIFFIEIQEKCLSFTELLNLAE